MRAAARAVLVAIVALLAGCAAGGGGAPPAAAPPPAVTEADRPPAAPPPRAAWRPARVRADAPLLPARTVTLLPGETLAAAAARAGASPGALAAANGIAPGEPPAPGRTLTVPAGRTHAVRAGETLSAIARAYAVPLARVARANRLSAPYPLEIGDRVLIPPSPPRAALRPSAARAPDPARATAPRPSSPSIKLMSEAPAAPPPTVEGRAHAYNLNIDALLGAPSRRLPPRAASVGRSTSPHTALSPAASAHGKQAARSGPTGAAGAPATPPAAPFPRSNPATSAPTLPAPAPAPTPTAEARPIALVWPLSGRILSAFGAKPGGRFNDGINIAAASGTTVRAAADGTVAYAGSGVPAFGNLLLIRHEGGWLTAYAHLDALIVAKGDTVRSGQPIARAGATGEVDQPQLHFELRRGRIPIDPLRYLARAP